MIDSNHKITNADCMDAMADMDENSVHAVVTDPPYNFEGGFMGEEWDNVGTPKEYQEWCEAWASEAIRVLKPGGHLIAFSSTGTYHRLASGIENAGFEIRDQLDWNYGQGFPKGATPAQWMDGDDAEKWDGWKTALKPAHEPAVLARAPMSESAAYRNVLEHGCGALNIDRTRIPTSKEDAEAMGRVNTDGPARFSDIGSDEIYSDANGADKYDTTQGRYPANLLLDGVAARMLDEQSGHLEPGGQSHHKEPADPDNLYGGGRHAGTTSFTDSGGASRFFYTAKSSKSERTIDGQVENEHPTVKPLSLMEYLVTLVTAPGQTVLDPFAGSGTTIMACRRLNREGIGIEKDADHAELARKRVELAHELETDWNNSSPEETADGPGEDNGSNQEEQQGLDVFTDGGESE